MVLPVQWCSPPPPPPPPQEVREVWSGLGYYSRGERLWQSGEAGESRDEYLYIYANAQPIIASVREF